MNIYKRSLLLGYISFIIGFSLLRIFPSGWLSASIPEIIAMPAILATLVLVITKDMRGKAFYVFLVLSNILVQYVFVFITIIIMFGLGRLISHSGYAALILNSSMFTVLGWVLAGILYLVFFPLVGAATSYIMLRKRLQSPPV